MYLISGAVKTGLDVLVEEKLKSIEGDKVGLVINHTALTRDLEFIVDVFRRCGKEIPVVFSPEHGLMGDVADAVKVESYRDPDLDVYVYSLYGKTYEPPLDLVRDLDALVYDIQDLGVRWYTFISTLYYSLRAAAKANTPIYVLDRPNPVTGVAIEGPVLDPRFKSFVGIYRLPTRYALTCGELALLYNKEEGFNADLKVIEMRNWRRSMWYDETGLIWVPPSPNIPSLETATIYLGTCLIEGTNISEGRGTPNPFVYIGAPWIKPRDLARRMNSLNLKGVKFRPIYFRPSVSKYAGERCGGVQVHLIDREKFQPLRTGLYLIKTVMEMYPDKFEWRVFKGEYFFDKLIGRGYVRKYLEEGYDIEYIEETWLKDLQEYRDRIKDIMLYG